MELVARFSKDDIAQKSCDLFHVVMQTSVSLAYSMKKWNAFRSTLHGAYKWDKFLPWSKIPKTF